MTPKELATRLNNREYGEEITAAEEKLARENNLVVVFGYSDDNMELRGAITEEVGVGEDTEIQIYKTYEIGILPDFENVKDDEDAAKYYFGCKENVEYKIRSIWGKDGYSFVYETNADHETFDIMENNGKYCRGIVFHVGKV